MDQNNQNKNIQNSLSDNSSLATLLLSLTNNNTGSAFQNREQDQNKKDDNAITSTTSTLPSTSLQNEIPRKTSSLSQALEHSQCDLPRQISPSQRSAIPKPSGKGHVKIHEFLNMSHLEILGYQGELRELIKLYADTSKTYKDQDLKIVDKIIKVFKKRNPTFPLCINDWAPKLMIKRVFHNSRDYKNKQLKLPTEKQNQRQYNRKDRKNNKKTQNLKKPSSPKPEDSYNNSDKDSDNNNYERGSVEELSSQEFSRSNPKKTSVPARNLAEKGSEYDDSEKEESPSSQNSKKLKKASVPARNLAEKGSEYDDSEKESVEESSSQNNKKLKQASVPARDLTEKDIEDNSEIESMEESSSEELYEKKLKKATVEPKKMQVNKKKRNVQQLLDDNITQKSFKVHLTSNKEIGNRKKTKNIHVDDTESKTPPDSRNMTKSSLGVKRKNVNVESTPHMRYSQRLNKKIKAKNQDEQPREDKAIEQRKLRDRPKKKQ